MALSAVSIALLLQYTTSFNAVGKDTNILRPLSRAFDSATWGHVDKSSFMQVWLEYDQLGRISKYEAPSDDGHQHKNITRAHTQHGQLASKAVPVEKVAIEDENSRKHVVRIKRVAVKSKSHTKTIFETVAEYDQNGDKIITEQELSVKLKMLNAIYWTDAEIHTLFESLDMNRDGMLQYEEFMIWISTAEANKNSGNSSGSNSPGSGTKQENSSAPDIRWDGSLGPNSAGSDALQDNSSSPDTRRGNISESNSSGSDTPQKNSTAPDTRRGKISESNSSGSDTLRKNTDGSLGPNNSGSDTLRENSSVPASRWGNSFGSKSFGSDAIRENRSGPDTQKDNSSVPHTQSDKRLRSNSSGSDTIQDKSSTPDIQKGNSSPWSHIWNKSGVDSTQENSSLPDTQREASTSEAHVTVHKDEQTNMNGEIVHYDIDKNHVITEDELYKGLKKLDPVRFTHDRIKQLLERLDTDADGKLQYDEFAPWILKRWQRGERATSEADRMVHEATGK